MKGAKEVLNLQEELFINHRSYIIALVGQHKAIQEIEILLDRTKYDIWKAIVSSSDQECITKLEQIHSELSKASVNSLPNNSIKSEIDSYLLHVGILLKKPHERTEFNLKEKDQLDTMLDTTKWLVIMNIMTAKYQKCSIVEDEYKCKIALNRLKCRIVNTFRKLAEVEYHENNLDRASLLIRRAYLSESLVDLLEFKNMKFLKKSVIEIEGIDTERIIFPLTEKFDEEIILYIRQRLHSDCTSFENSNIVYSSTRKQRAIKR